MENPQTISEKQLQKLVRFVVLVYQRTSSAVEVNAARQTLSAQGSRTIQNIPPSQAALFQHLRPATYQGGHKWGRCLQANQNIPDPSDLGWELSDGKWAPKWTTLQEASKVSRELIRWGCKIACRGLCKCFNASLRCTPLCACEGNCHHD